MRIELNLTSYDGCDLIAQVSRSTSSIPGLTTLTATIELPIATTLPQTPQLISCTLSEDTGTPIKWFTGWYLGATAKPSNNNQSFTWTFKVVDVLFYLANSKTISNYSNSTTLEAHADDLATLAERPSLDGAYRYIDFEVAPTDTDPFGFAIENNSFNLQQAITELAKKSGYEIVVQEVGWTDHATLFASTSSITRILFREPGSSEQLAPIPLIVWDPTDPDFCEEFPFTDFVFGWDNQGLTSSEVRGKGGDKAKEDGETIITSYSKYRSIPIKTPQTDPAITEFDFAFELSADINKLNQVLVLPELGQLTVLFPYDPNTPLTANQCYFDKESNPPRVIFFQDDITGLTVNNTCYVLENFQFIKVIETDSASSSALSSATHGAFDKAYITTSDPSIADFPSATSIAQSTLAEAKKGNFFCSGKRLTTTENWLNGQLMQVQIPSQDIDKFVKVVSSSGTVKGKVFDIGANEHRDEVDYSLSFAEVDKNIFTRGFLGRLGGITGGGGGNNPGFPTYDEIPFDSGGGACLTTTGITGENYAQVSQLFSFDFSLPTDPESAVSIVHTADIANVKESTSVSFYIAGTIDTTEGNLVITFEGDEIYNQPLNAATLDRNKIISLRSFAGTSGQVVATLTLDAQPTTTTSYNLFIVTDCCVIDTFAGTGTAGFNFDGGGRLLTDLNNPTKVHVDADGHIYIADALNYRLRKVDKDTGLVTTIGGTGDNSTLPTSGGAATDQDLGKIRDFVIFEDKIYLLLDDWIQVAKIDLSNGNYYLIDDDFTYEGFVNDKPYGITVDSLGNLYYGTAGASVVYKLVGETTRTTYAGMFNSPGFSGDGGLATDAELYNPNGLEVDSEDNLYIASVDGARNVVRKVNSSDGIINTICGNGSLSEFDVDAASYRIQDDSEIAISIDKNTQDIYVKADQIILKINKETNIITRFAGITDAILPGFGGDKGSPITAIFDFNGTFFGGLHVVSATEVYVADENNNRIRKISCGDMALSDCPDTSTITSNPSSSVSGGTFGSITTNPAPNYAAGNNPDTEPLVVGISFEIDLTNAAFVGHDVSLNVDFTNTAAIASSDSDISMLAHLKFNSVALYTLSESESITAPGTMTRSFTETISLNDYIGTILTIDIDATLEATDPSGVTLSSSLSASFTC